MTARTRNFAVLAGLVVVLAVDACRIPFYLDNARPDRYLLRFDYFLCYASVHALQAGLPDIYGRAMAEFAGRLSGGLWHIPDNHLPPFYLYYLPFSGLKFASAWLAHITLSTVLYIAAIMGLASFLVPHTRPGRRLAIGALIAAASLLAPICVDTLLLGQIDFALFAALALTFILSERGWDDAAGFCLAQAILMKGFPGLLLVYFLARRRWRLVAATAVSVGLMAGTAWMLWGSDNFRSYAAANRHASYYMLPSNQSFMGWLVLRVPAGTTLAWLKGVHGLLVAVALCILLGLRRRGRDDRMGAVLEVSCYVMAAMIVAPFNWPHHHVLTMLPGVAFVAAGLAPVPRIRGGLLAAGLGLLALLWVGEGEILATFWPPEKNFLAAGGGLFTMVALFIVTACARAFPPGPDVSGPSGLSDPAPPAAKVLHCEAANFTSPEETY